MLSGCFFQKNLEAKDNNAPSIADLNLSKQEISYPDEWPVEFRLPDSFILVEVNSGTSIGGSQQGWTAMYRFKGNVDEVEEAINKYFKQNNWDILISENQEAGGYILLLEKGEMEGFTVIEVDPDSDRETLIMITVFR